MCRLFLSIIILHEQGKLLILYFKSNSQLSFNFSVSLHFDINFSKENYLKTSKDTESATYQNI